MLEESILQLSILSLFVNVFLTIISFMLIVILTIKVKKENHTSANQ